MNTHTIDSTTNTPHIHLPFSPPLPTLHDRYTDTIQSISVSLSASAGSRTRALYCTTAHVVPFLSLVEPQPCRTPGTHHACMTGGEPPLSADGCSRQRLPSVSRFFYLSDVRGLEHRSE
jgi:hypothetical protein